MAGSRLLDCRALRWSHQTRCIAKCPTLIGSAHRTPTGEPVTVTGVLNGSADRDEICMTIYWPDNLIEKYVGIVNSEGKVHGTRIENENAASEAHWHAEPRLAEWR